MKERKQKKRVLGVVTSDRMDKTITVKTSRLILHPRFHKYIKRETIFKAHDEKNEARKGDVVEIIQSRPLSKTKFWKLARIVKRTEGLPEEEESAAFVSPELEEMKASLASSSETTQESEREASPESTEESSPGEGTGGIS